MVKAEEAKAVRAAKAVAAIVLMMARAMMPENTVLVMTRANAAIEAMMPMNAAIVVSTPTNAVVIDVTAHVLADPEEAGNLLIGCKPFAAGERKFP